MKHVTTLLAGTTVGCAAVLAFAVPASAATAAPIDAKPGVAISIKPSYTDDVQGATRFTVPSGMTIDRIVSSGGADATAGCGAFTADRTAITCGTSTTVQNATDYLFAVATASDKAQYGIRNATIAVTDGAGAVTASTDFSIRFVPAPPVVTGVAYDAEGTATITGTGVPGNTVDVRNYSTPVTTVTIGADGTFSVELPAGIRGLVVLNQGDGTGYSSSASSVMVTPPVPTPIIAPAVAGGAGVLAVALAGIALYRRRAAGA